MNRELSHELCQEVERIGEALPNLAARHSQWIRGGISGMKRSGATYPLILQAQLVMRGAGR